MNRAFAIQNRPSSRRRSATSFSPGGSRNFVFSFSAPTIGGDAAFTAIFMTSSMRDLSIATSSVTVRPCWPFGASSTAPVACRYELRNHASMFSSRVSPFVPSMSAWYFTWSGNGWPPTLIVKSGVSVSPLASSWSSVPPK